MTEVLDQLSVVTMPMLSPDMTEGRLVRWFVREGQMVEEGDLLAEVSFGASTVEVEAKAQGRIASLAYAAGASGIAVHAPIARIETKSVSERGSPKDETGVERAEGEPQARTRDVVSASRKEHALDRALASCVVMQSYREALRDALDEATRRDPRIVVFGEDVVQNRGAQRVTQGLHDTYGDKRVVTLRPFDDGACGLAVGAALGGCVAVVEVAAWGPALEAMTAALDAATQLPALSGGRVSVPIVLRGPCGWTPGASGVAASPIAARLVQIAGLKVLAPSTPASAKLLLDAALSDGGPVALLEAEDLYAAEGPVPHAPSHGDVIGQAHIAVSGERLTVVSYGRLVSRVIAIAERLSHKGIAIEVVDLLSLRPLDTETIKASLLKTRRLLIVEDGPQRFGIGAEIISRLAADPAVALDAPPVQLGGFEGPLPYSSAYDALILPSEERIERAIAHLLG